MDILALFAGNVLVWVAGVAVVSLLPSARVTGTTSWSLGCGWFVGVLVLTMWMRALSAMGIEFGLVSVGFPLLLVALAAAAYQVTRRGAGGSREPARLRSFLSGDALSGWQRASWIALLAWLALRFALLLGEVLERPLYPWDAWTQWSTKAKVWFELRSMAPFVPLQDWLAPGATGFTDAAPHYPATVPLVQVWSALIVGRWDDVLVNLPWWIAGVALTIAVYGWCRGVGLERLAALAVAWLVASMPMPNVHVALAGYADLWMSAYLTLGVLAGLRQISLRAPRDVLLAIVLLAGCVTIKNPGKAWLVVLIPGALAAFLPRVGLKAAIVCIAGAALTLAALMRVNASFLGYTMRLEFVPPWQGLWDAYFAYANWHFLWFGAIAVAIVARRHLLSAGLAPLTLVVATGLLFLFFGFAFTNAAQWVADQSTVNRATMHLAPLVTIWMALVFKRWLETLHTGANVAGPATQGQTG